MTEQSRLEKPSQRGKTNPDVRLFSGLLHWFRQHEWSVVAGLALLAFVLGLLGYYEHLILRQKGVNHNLWDVFYNTLRLFFLEGHDTSRQWPVYLQVARLLAPFTLVYTAVKAIWLQIRRFVGLYRLSAKKRQFVLVCGLGETGYRLARAYATQTDKAVVALEPDPLNPQASKLQELGVMVLQKSALDTRVLREVRAATAKEIFVCTESDETNIAIAKEVERLTREVTLAQLNEMNRIVVQNEPSVGGEPPFLPLRCFVRVEDPGIHEVFREHPFFSLHNERFCVKVFNQQELTARALFQLCAPDLYRRSTSERSSLRVILLGFDRLMEEWLLQLALNCHYEDLRKLDVCLLCNEEEREHLELLLHRFPKLTEILSLEVHELEWMLLSDEDWFALQEQGEFSVGYVAMEADVDSILTARRFQQYQLAAEKQPLPFVVFLNQQTLLSEILDDNFAPLAIDKTALLQRAECIEYVKTLDQTMTLEIVVHEILDRMARTIHESYLESQFARGETRETNPSLIPWLELPPHKKKANQHAAGHMDVKLRIAGCQRLPLEAAGEPVEFPGDEELLDVLAQIEHRRWMADKWLAGYTWGAERNERRKHHPDLVGWEELTESDRDKDRHNILQTSRLLGMQGEKICRSNNS